MSSLRTQSPPEASPVVRRLTDLPTPPGVPVLGHALALSPRQAHLQMEAWARELGSPFRLKLGPRHVVVWTNPEVLQKALRDRPQHFARSPRVSAIMAEMGLDGLFAAEGAAWEPQRRLVMSALHPNSVAHFFPILEGITQRLYRRWAQAAETGQILEMVDELMRYTVDVTCAFAFGEDPNTIEQGPDRIQQQLGLIFPMLIRRSIAPIPHWRWVRLPQDRALDRALLEVDTYVQGLIGRARMRLQQDAPSAPRNALESFLRAADEPGSGVTDRMVRANVMTLLLAGEDTTANALAWSLRYVATDTALQTRLHNLAKVTLGADASVCSSVALVKQMDFFECVVQEALRLHPVIGMLGFTPYEDTDIGGLHVPAGVLNYYVHRPAMLDPQHFHAPEQFDPDRWMARHSASGAAPSQMGSCPHHAGAHNTRAFMQFGAGPRVCPGRHLAGMEMRLVLSMLTRNFRLSLACEPDAIQEVCAFTVRPDRMPVRLAHV